MIRVLQVNSSLFGASGQSTGLADAFVEQVRRQHSDARVTRRDLMPDAIPHLDQEIFSAFATPPEQRSPDQHQRVTLSDNLIAELQAADLIVIGLPMYNFSVPSTLKAWFDHVARAGITFRYTDSGPEGLLKGKRAVIACARGGRYSGDSDTQTPYIRQFLGFLGIEDVEFVYADGLAMGKDTDQSVLDARNSLERIAENIETTIVTTVAKKTGTHPEQSGVTA